MDALVRHDGEPLERRAHVAEDRFEKGRSLVHRDDRRSVANAFGSIVSPSADTYSIGLTEAMQLQPPLVSSIRASAILRASASLDPTLALPLVSPNQPRRSALASSPRDDAASHGVCIELIKAINDLADEMDAPRRPRALLRL
ncbi:MAG: hypothetical protein SGPRY_009975 [Prymnesium sp.]